MHSLSDAFPLPIKEEGKGISPGVSIKLKLLQKKFLVRRIFFFNAFPNEKCHVRFGSEVNSSRSERKKRRYYKGNSSPKSQRDGC